MDAVHPVEVTAHWDAEAPVAGPVGQTALPPAGQVPLLGLVVEGAALLVEAGALPGVVEPVAEPVGLIVLLLVEVVLLMGLIVGLIVLVDAEQGVQELAEEDAPEVAVQVVLVAQSLMTHVRERVQVIVPEGALGHVLVGAEVIALDVQGHVVVDVRPVVQDAVDYALIDATVVVLPGVAVPVQGDAKVVPGSVQLLVVDALGVPVAAVDVAADVIAAAPLGVKDPVPAAAKDALENALPAVADALGALDVLETVLGNAPADATPTAPAAQETAKGTAPSRALTLAPPLVMGLARLA